MLKVAVIGGGSTYTPELINGFLARLDKFPVNELWLMDIDKERLDIVGGFAQRMVEAKGAPFKVTLSTNQREAIRGTTYVTTQLRVGMMEARRNDEYLVTELFKIALHAINHQHNTVGCRMITIGK